MKTNNEMGRRYVVIVGIYLIAKCILNMFIGGGFDFGGLLFAVVSAAALFSGLQYVNYVVAALMALTVITNLPHNLTHLPSTLIYLIEAVIDAGAIYFLVTKEEIKEHFTNKWDELSELINK